METTPVKSRQVEQDPNNTAHIVKIPLSSGTAVAIRQSPKDKWSYLDPDGETIFWADDIFICRGVEILLHFPAPSLSEALRGRSLVTFKCDEGDGIAMRIPNFAGTTPDDRPWNFATYGSIYQTHNDDDLDDLEVDWNIDTHSIKPLGIVEYDHHELNIHDRGINATEAARLLTEAFKKDKRPR